MTNKQAIEELNGLIEFSKCRLKEDDHIAGWDKSIEALNMAIKKLGKENCNAYI